MIYEEDGDLVSDDVYFDGEIGKDLVAHATGDITGDYEEDYYWDYYGCDEDCAEDCEEDHSEIVYYTYYSPVINVTDLVELMDMIYTADGTYVAVADINKDGKVDILIGDNAAKRFGNVF